MLAERIKQRRRKAEVALHELLGVLRTVYSREIKDKIAFGAPSVQLLHGAVKIVLKDSIHDKISVALGLACFDIIKLGAKVSTHETLCSGYQNLHPLFTSIVARLRSWLKTEVFADEIEFEEKFLHALDIQSLRVVTVIVLHAADRVVAFREELVVV